MQSTTKDGTTLIFLTKLSNSKVDVEIPVEKTVVGDYNLNETFTATLTLPEGETLTVDFDGRFATYGFESLPELEHAWAMTVHKAQGSEYRAVILSLAASSPMLMTRDVLYTAVTRAKELLILVGDDGTAYQMIDNYRQSRRYTALRVRLAALAGAGA